MNVNCNRSSDEYRNILATANKLKAIQTNLNSVSDFFSTSLVKLYAQLCNDSDKFLLRDEFKLDQFRRTEELVWKRVYHDIYRFFKTKKGQLTAHDERLLGSHFLAGIGFYSNRVIKLRVHHNISDDHVQNDPLNLNIVPIDDFDFSKKTEGSYKRIQVCDETNTPCSSSSNDSEDSRRSDWAHQSIYRSLICMGDLARYLMELSKHDYRNLAFQFYISATRAKPEHGLPFNQIAALSGDTNYHLDAVCNYMRSCLKPRPFEGAEGNLMKIFDLNAKVCDEITGSDGLFRLSGIFASREPLNTAQEMMQIAIVKFLRLVSHLWTRVSSEEDQSCESELTDHAKSFLEILKEVLYLEPIIPLAPKISLNEQIFCPVTGGSSVSDKPRYLSPTIMYEFCSILIMMMAKCQSNFSSSKSYKPKGNQIINLVHNLTLNLLHCSMSKCEETILGKVQELRIYSQDFLQIDSPSDGSMNTSTDNELEESYAFVYAQTYLPTIKLLCDWLSTNDIIIGSNLEFFKAVFTKLADILHILQDLRKLSCHEEVRSDTLKLKEEGYLTIQSVEIFHQMLGHYLLNMGCKLNST